MYARTIASAASPGKLASVDDLIRAESLQIVAFLLGPTGGGEGRERRYTMARSFDALGQGAAALNRKVIEIAQEN